MQGITIGMAFDDMLAPRKVVNKDERGCLTIDTGYTLVDIFCREDDREGCMRPRGPIEEGQRGSDPR